ncbi:aconitase X catalytic domain-containing protein [Anaerovorax odorimutans]|uniref:Aconitase X catalytic domain-containing protein n=1 Tax=Anaerovorax odorimutans TaxID=109327 RepID=A0ABT1RPA7_9FIRM|nr:aconitase X [Anaerovorax odorimutans]MCQ4637005.1 aconitase X catalytic domain-containing protein [Anaerovorax odorimutans]
MKLSEKDRKMLNGEFGEVKKLAMEKTIEYAKVLGAEELIDVDKSTSCYDDMSDFLKCGNDLDSRYSLAYLGKEMKLDSLVADHCFCQDDACGIDGESWEALNHTKEFYDYVKGYLDRAQELGVIRVSCCTPYLTGWIPLMGEVFVTTESSNILMCNSIFGARGNCGGQATTFLATLTGRTPKWGYHLDENRYGTHIVHIQCKTESRQDWDLLGYVLGTQLSSGDVPIIADGFKKPDLTLLKKFFTPLATTSNAELCFFVGLSPEARTLEDALKGHAPKGEIVITQEMIDNAKNKLCHQEPGEVDYIEIGCPHCGIEELQEFSSYMKGKKVKDGVKFIINTAFPMLKTAEVNGYAQILRDAGIYISTCGCLNVHSCAANGAKAIALSSAKLTHYQKTEQSVPVYYGSDKELMDAAVTGYWGGK